MNDNEKYLRPEEASKLLKVTVRTLEMWECKGQIKCIRTKGGHRRFLLSDVISRLPEESKPKQQREKICYCRVSTSSQKEDLERQVDFFRLKYPDYRIIKDIGSGINFKRKGFNSILSLALQGNLQTLVVTHKDRLCRFGFDLIETIIKHTDGEIVVLDHQQTSPEKELVNDLLSIITVFSSRLYGLRSHSLRNKIKTEALKNTEISSLPDSSGTIETSTDV